MPNTGADRGESALITGVGGFTGLHLVRFLLSEGLEVYGLDRDTSSPALHDLGSAFHLLIADLLDQDILGEIIRDIRPAYIFHLAAATPSDGLAQLLTNTVQATDHLLQAASRWAPVKIFIPGSAAEYGAVRPDELPITEHQPLRPVSPYGVSKTAQVLLAQSCYLTTGLDIYIGRPFNLIGPGEQPTMVCSAIAHQIAAIEQGIQEPIVRVGNLASERDFVDIRDVVQAYWAIVTRGRPGEVYNICSGSATSIQGLLDMLLDMARVPVEVRGDLKRLQQCDVPRSVGDSQKLRTQTGWQPKVSLAQTLADVLEYWRALYRADDLPPIDPARRVLTVA